MEQSNIHNSCINKLKRLSARIKAIEDFLNQTKNSGITYGEWLIRKGADPKMFAVPLGYYKNQVCSLDYENSDLEQLYSSFVYLEEAGYPLPIGGTLSESEHDEVTSSMLGYTFNPNLNTYFPTTIYDCIYESIYTDKTQCSHLMGGLSDRDILNITSDGKQKVAELYVNLMEEEADNVAEYLEFINGEHSNASGDSRPALNATCRAGCDTKHPFNKEKRESCKQECDSKFPPSQKQDERREDRKDRQDARDAFRDEKKRCEDEFRVGRLSKSEYKRCKREGREEKKRELENVGRSGLLKGVRAFQKVNPITATGRNAALVAISQFNLLGFATRMYPAFATGEELRKYKPEYVNVARNSWIKISRAWKNLGGDPDKLKQAIINGRNKKAHKEPEYSNAIDPATVSIIKAALGVVGSLIGLLTAQLNRSNVSKDPFEQGFAPNDFKDELDSGELDYSPDENSPILDENGNWIDPKTGKRVDPESGENLIMGIRSTYFWVGVSAIAVIATGIIIFANRKKSK
jgi:hypothetical protein